MKKTNKLVKVALPYHKWLEIIRGCNIAIGTHEKMSPAEAAMTLSYVKQAKDELLEQVAKSVSS